MLIKDPFCRTKVDPNPVVDWMVLGHVENIQISKGIDLRQNLNTAQADMVWYFLQVLFS